MFDARYAARDENGIIYETFEQAVDRLAKVASSVEENQKHWYSEFKYVLENLLLVPSTPIWANIGKDDREWQPSACFVLDIEDDLHEMYKTLTDTALIFKSGGGVGYNFSKIRPKGSLVNSTKGKASGVVELIKLYDASSSMVMQGGVRRGASMAILNIDHPEIIDFINAKLNGELPNFNLSVGVFNSFMDALEADGYWDLQFNGIVHQTIRARELWRIIVEASYACGDPGLIFLDHIQHDNPMIHVVLRATNPCGEQPLAIGESCLLASINLARLLVGTPEFYRVIQIAVRFLDNMIEVAQYPLVVIAEATLATRKIGLGYTGLADALFKARFAYDSEEGRMYAKRITGSLRSIAYEASIDLAKEKGCFPEWCNSTFYPNIPMRNATRVTMAPTGSVTTVAGCEGYGVEPIFAVAYKKSTNVAGDFEVFSPLFVEACNEYKVPTDVMVKVAELGTCQGVEGVPGIIQHVFKGAQDIAVIDHLLMQSAIQEEIDNAVSKTINMPKTATMLDVNEAFRAAYKLNLKGITVFRDGCKKGTITVGEGNTTKIVAQVGCVIKKRPESAPGETFCLLTGCGKLYLTVNYEHGEILEAFITTGSDGGCLIYTEATSRLISLAVRAGIPIEVIVEQLKSTHACPSYMHAKGAGKKLSRGKSCPSIIANKLQEITDKIKTREQVVVQIHDKAMTQMCEICGEQLRAAEGCFVCTNCGYSKC